MVRTALLLLGIVGSFMLIGGSVADESPRAARFESSLACASHVRGDFDGDGRRDLALVSTSAVDCESTANRWLLTVRFGSGRSVRLSLTDSLSGFGLDCQPHCRAFAVRDFNRDGRAELEVSVLQGASGGAVVVYEVGKQRIYRVGRVGYRVPFTLDYYASLGHGATVVCRTTRTGSRRIVQVHWANSIDAAGRSWLREETYVFKPSRFRLVSKHESYHPASEGYPPTIRGTECS